MPYRLGPGKIIRHRIYGTQYLALKRYFNLHELEVETWFNVIAPAGGSLQLLRNDLVKLVGKNWKEIRRA